MTWQARPRSAKARGRDPAPAAGCHWAPQPRYPHNRACRERRLRNLLRAPKVADHSRTRHFVSASNTSRRNVLVSAQPTVRYCGRAASEERGSGTARRSACRQACRRRVCPAIAASRAAGSRSAPRLASLYGARKSRAPRAHSPCGQTQVKLTQRPWQSPIC